MKKKHYQVRCLLTFDYGQLIMRVPGRTTTYDTEWEYYGDTITQTTMNQYINNYNINDLIENGLYWDEKWYNNSSFTSETITPITVYRDTTFFANPKRVIRFNVVDEKHLDTNLTGVTITINGTTITPLSVSGYTDYDYIVEAPSSDESAMFTLRLTKTGYNSITATYSVNTLDEKTVFMLKTQQSDEFNIHLQWFPQSGQTGGLDMDSHLLIYSASDLTDSVAHLSYQSTDKISDYTGHASGVVKDSGIFYELDYDDTNGGHGFNENISGKVVDGRIYKFIVHNYSSDLMMSDNGTIVQLIFNNKRYPGALDSSVQSSYNVPFGNPKYWIVFEIKKDDGQWIVNTINTPSNEEPWGEGQ